MTSRSGNASVGALCAALWQRLWFVAAPARPLAVVRIVTGVVALVLWWSWWGDIAEWFGPEGVLPPDTVREWRSPWGVSVWDFARSAVAVRGAHLALGVALLLLTVGCATPVAAVLAAVGFASLLNRGPMLAGPADDCVAVLLWCLVVGRAGDDLSVDRWLADRAGRAPAEPSLRNRIALSLLLILGFVITLATLLAQLKGDVWWDGSAVWWLAGRQAPALQFQPLYRRSEYLMNGTTHAVTLFEALFAAGLGVPGLRRAVGWMGVGLWPVVGMLAGEPWWGAAMAAFAVAVAVVPIDRDQVAA
jgi:hypothetical protein